MPAYNFKPIFAQAVESGEKTQTIRRWNRGAHPGAIAYLYTGQRTKACRKLGEGVVTSVMPIEIGRHACGEPYAVIITESGKQIHLVHRDLDALAVDDGFEAAAEMVEWFAAQHELPFNGFLHLWKLLPGDQSQ